MVEGFTDKKGKFHPTESTKGVSSSSVNSDTKVTTTTSSLGEKHLQKETIKITIDKPNEKSIKLAEDKVESKQKKNLFGNVYQFENNERWFIVNNTNDANKLAEKELKDIYKQMGILAWEKSYIESFIDEEILKRKMGVSFHDIYNGKNNTPNFKLAKEVPINIDEMIEKSVKNDGASHSLAKFDGKEVKLKDGTLMYRMS